MALTELQQPSKQDLYAALQSLSGELLRLRNKVKQTYEFIDKMDATTLDNMSVPSGDVRTDMVDFRNLLSEIVTLFDNTSVTPAKDPLVVINNIRRISVS